MLLLVDLWNMKYWSCHTYTFTPYYIQISDSNPLWETGLAAATQADLGQPTYTQRPITVLFFYAIAPPPSVGWFLTHLGRCSRETLRHWISAQHWLVFWAWESEFWNQSGGRERARRQNDGDFIPDGHRHVLATNGRDEEKDCGSPLFCSVGSQT